MSKKVKTKKSYPLDFKTMYGLSTMGWVSTGAAAFMTSLFMLYLTDYSGIGAAAASIGTFVLFAGRIIDAIDDPLQGWIMDNTKTGKLGKYKPFIIASIIISTIGLIALYCLPSAVTRNVLLASIWIIFFYIVFEIGTSFFAEMPLKQTLSDDPYIREKTIQLPRIISTLVAIPFSFFIAMVTGLNKSVGNMHTSFVYMTLLIMLPICIISLIGISCVKEGKHQIDEEQPSEKITLKDIVSMFQSNKALKVQAGAALLNGFVWTLIFATVTYYVKWSYAADISTGVVDSGKLGLYVTIMGAMQMFALMGGAMISPTISKKLGDPLKTIRISLIGGIITGFSMWLLSILGILGKSPVLFFVLLFLQLLATGLSYTPVSVIWIECMDYGKWKTDKQLSGMVNACSKFIEKAQTAISSALVGVILIVIGYTVNSKTDEYIGDLSALPSMLQWFMVIAGLLPAILSAAALFIYRFYPINPRTREQMREELKKK